MQMSRFIPFRPALVIATAGAALAGALAVAGTAAASGSGVTRDAAGMAGSPASAGATLAGRGSGHRSASSAIYNWPMFGAGRAHFGVSAETAISTATAPSLTARWTARLGTPSYTSPAVVTIGSLGKALVYVGANNILYAYP